MRCHLKQTVAVGVLFLVALAILNKVPSSRHAHGSVATPTIRSPFRSGDMSERREPPLSTMRLSSKDSWIEQGDYLPFNISYQLLAGVPSSKHRFLAIGLASVKRLKGNYLLNTLRSIFSQSSQEDRSTMVVVLLLPDFDALWRDGTVRELRAAFTSELEQGQLLVIHVPQQYYPPLTGLKRNYNDPPDRVYFRSKQNVDYSFLLHYSAGLSQYYLQLEDDVAAARNFLSTIGRHVQEQNALGVRWATLEFSRLGYIGKLYRSAELPQLARLLFIFYQEMPCDWLLTHFHKLLTQNEPIRLKPSLFQHMGVFSSFKGNYNVAMDKDFDEEPYSNPSADVYSNMSVYKNHGPIEAWNPGTGFFWGRSPIKGNCLTVVFKDPVVVKEVFVVTGSSGTDLLQSAVVELGREPVNTENGERSCKEFHLLGSMEKGLFVMQDMEKQHSSASSCLRIQVTADQIDWVVIEKIRVTTWGNLTLSNTHHLDNGTLGG